MAEKKQPPPPPPPENSSLAEAKTMPPVDGDPPERVEITNRVQVDANIDDPVEVNLQGTPIERTRSQTLWTLIRSSARSISFENYESFIRRCLCTTEYAAGYPGSECERRENLLLGVDAYKVLRTATEAFVLTQVPSTMTIDTKLNQDEERIRFGGTLPDNIQAELTAYLNENGGMLPYINRITSGLRDASRDNPFCSEGIVAKLPHPALVELIWSYWMEEGKLVQAINAISLRFQNKRGASDRDPLVNVELHPLRPLANLLWGYIQDEDHRLTIARRAYEYEHQYGLSLIGKAVPRMRLAERRSQFLGAFHALLRQAAIFYDRSANLTVRADGFPLLNALREVHLLLAEGAHNQFRDLPWTARVEMLIQQYLLSRREIHEFLGGRPAVPYSEPWIAPVDSLARLMGWNDSPTTHFRDLAINGEMIVLSIRYGDWSDANSEAEAKGWAHYWKTEIQRYIHAYRAVTGIDLGVGSDGVSARPVDATQPSVLLHQRLARQRGAQ